jgi:hypothetical protein
MNYPNFYMKNISGTLTGHFDLNTPHDEWLILRTREWPMHYCQGEWRYRGNVDEPGVIWFDFELQDDANKFREITRQLPTLITCR